MEIWCGIMLLILWGLMIGYAAMINDPRIGVLSVLPCCGGVFLAMDFVMLPYYKLLSSFFQSSLLAGFSVVISFALLWIILSFICMWVWACVFWCLYHLRRAINPQEVE